MNAPRRPTRAELEQLLANLTRERDGLLDVIAKATREATDLRRQIANVTAERSA